ncbi:MAG: malto-oligosyltrehalose synthase [Actinomycetota bacterium]
MTTVPRRATYRLQLRNGIDLDDAAALVPYLARLGISHLYCSPYLTAAPGSTHGYDGVDPTTVDPALGGEAARGRLVSVLREHGMGHLLDIVPNHLAVSMPANRWLDDVARHGPVSEHARFFDIDWASAERRLGRPVVMVPLLGDHLGRLGEAGEVRLDRIDGDVYASVHGLSWPMRPESQAELIGVDLDALAADADRLWTLLEEQHVRPVWWRMGEAELDYRRFFDVDQLMAVRVEDEEVFDATHATVLGWLADGSLDGVRIDHIDGLTDPAGYLARLRDRAPGAWIVIEKVVEGEELLLHWPCDGDSGYDVGTDLALLSVDPAGEASLTELAAELTGDDGDWEAVARLARREAVTEVVAADLERVVDHLEAVRDRHRRFRDLSRRRLTDAVIETVVGFDVYRTYLRRGEPADPEDRGVIAAAMGRAQASRPDLADGALALIEAALLGDPPFDSPVEDDFELRFQQLSGPVAAKGVEDTAMYRYVRLLARNDVGADPGRFADLDLDRFHAARRNDQEGWPERLITLSTHDTKRSGDVRARLTVLSEVTDDWVALVRRWHERNARHRSEVGPDGRDELVLYQTLVGAHPLGVDRALRYMEKASREAKIRTSWVDPVPEYDEAVADFVRALHEDAEFVAELDAFVERIVDAGRIVSLAQQLLAMTLPGVPDLYQGTELWDLSLVDPDNRRPVDFDTRSRLLDELGDSSLSSCWPDPGDGRAKLGLVHRTLRLRAERPASFGAGPAGAYAPLVTSGSRASHVLGYERGGEVAAVVPLRSTDPEWGDTIVELGDGSWVDVLGERTIEGGAVAAATLFEHFPVALLARERS